jgi:acylphosphatase
MKKAIHVKVSGLVQGVFFRKHTQNTAVKLGVNGWVRNSDDGSVEIEAEGDAKALDEFLKWCNKGPDRASVTELVIKEIDLQNFTSFEVKR